MSNVKREVWRFAVVVVIGVMAVFALEQYSYAEEFAVKNTKEFRQALENAADNGEDDTISLAPGTYKPSDDGAGAFEFVDSESKNITIKAKDGYEAKDVILDGEKKLRVLNIDITEREAQVKIEGISIVNGEIDGGGGGINSANKLTLNKCIIKNNYAETYDGGGVYCTQTLKIMDCILTGNAADRSGGAIQADILGGEDTVSDLVIINSNISQNKASSGGGIYAMNSGNIEISNSNIFQNKASSGKGGGFYCRTRNTVIKNSYIHENSAEVSGAGIYLDMEASEFIIINSVISKNVTISKFDDSEGSGSGLHSEAYDLSIINCVIAGNKSGGSKSAAIYSDGIFVNNIFSDNDNDIIVPSGDATIYNNYIDYAKIENSGEGNITKKNNVLPSDGTPLFVDTEFRTKSGSIIIDKGLDPNSLDFSKLYNDTKILDKIIDSLEFDKDGKPRIVGSTIDLGAYEFDPDAPPPVIVDPPVVTPPVERVSIDATLSMTIPNIKCDGQLLNIGLNLEFYNNTSGLLIWKLKSSSASTIQPLSSIIISTDYKISFPEFIYQNQTIAFPVILEPYFNKADPFTLYWKLAM